MKERKKLIFIIVLLVVLICVIGVVTFMVTRNKESKSNTNTNTTNTEEKKEPNDVKIDDFSYAFLKLEDNKENFIYSPLSIKYALYMLRDGADNNTKDQLDKLLKDTTLTKYKNIDKVLSLANSIFIRDTYKDKVYDSYTNTLKDNYNAEVIYDAFKDATNVNNWISDKTFGIIKNMLNDAIFANPELEMLLVNALAIDMDWEYKFENENTHEAKFTKENNEVINVAMMSKELYGSKILNNEDYTIVSLPLKKYEDTSLEFVAILPLKEDIHSFVTSDDFNTKLEKALSNMENLPTDKDYYVYLPRFKYDRRTSLEEDLQKLGVTDAFLPVADFSKIAETKLVVDKVLHKADIELSERGIKAAAATVITLKENAMIEQRERVNLSFNKPFMYIIRDTKTNELWFVGTVYEPLKWEDVKDDYK